MKRQLCTSTIGDELPHTALGGYPVHPPATHPCAMPCVLMSHDPRYYLLCACHTRSSTKRSQIAQRKSHWQRDMTSSMKDESAKRSSGLGVMPGDPISLGISVA
eukprot:scaffold5423_cov67-Phaeocystis_antarctica.AAC.1